MKTIPKQMNAYFRTEIFNEKTIPEGLLKEHRTAENIWGKITVLKGELTYVIEEPVRENVRLNIERHGVVEPMVTHHVIPQEGVRFYLEFYK